MALDESVQLDTSLGNVFQSALVLAVLLANGIRARWRTRPTMQAAIVPESLIISAAAEITTHTIGKG